MRAVVQRVRRATVGVGGELVGAVGPGLCVLLAVGPDDTEATAHHLAHRVATLRVHADAAGRMNRDLHDAGGAVLVVSQFTLYADTTRGHRPAFTGAARPERARTLCGTFCDALRARGLEVAEGRFGERMEVCIENDGPVTIVLSSAEGPWNADAG